MFSFSEGSCRILSLLCVIRMNLGSPTIATCVACKFASRARWLDGRLLSEQWVHFCHLTFSGPETPSSPAQKQALSTDTSCPMATESDVIPVTHRTAPAMYRHPQTRCCDRHVRRQGFQLPSHVQTPDVNAHKCYNVSFSHSLIPMCSLHCTL